MVYESTGSPCRNIAKKIESKKRVVCATQISGTYNTLMARGGESAREIT